MYLNLFSDILMRNVTVGVEAEIDTERGKGFAVLNPYVRLRVPGVLQLTVGELFTTGDRRINRAESNYFWADVYWYLSDTYTLDAYCRYDFARKSLGRQYVGLSRAFDCFTLQTGVEYDKIDNDVRWTVHVYPSGYDRRNR